MQTRYSDTSNKNVKIKPDTRITALRHSVAALLQVNPPERKVDAAKGQDRPQIQVLNIEV